MHKETRKRERDLYTMENQLKQLKETVEAIGKEISANIKDEKIAAMFEACFQSTATTTTRFLENGDAYVFTGDIEAMWLRDSSAQVIHYLPFLGEYPILKDLVKGLIKRQMFYIGIDPYANAFNEEANGNCWEKDITEDNPWNWERKYEIDSLCYPVWLLNQYYKKTEDKEIFDDQVKDAFASILHLFETEQHHEEKSPYRFQRTTGPASDTLTRQGKGTECAETGMTWCGFRPSDDACKYGYLIPSNIFAAAVLKYVANFAAEMFQDQEMADRALKLRSEILQGIETYGKISHEKYGTMYAYEVDGLGNYYLMDDANVPSLLSLPWIAEEEWEPSVYENTRKFLLSKDNPYYYEGTLAKGIGSPHTPDGYIWHIALVMQGLTSKDSAERKEILETLKRTDGDTGFMHEGFNPNAPKEFTRDWFAWANSLFALYIIELLNKEEI